MNQKNLSEALQGVVETCVNKVGVDLNTASAPLLAYISGINKTIAKISWHIGRRMAHFQRAVSF